MVLLYAFGIGVLLRVWLLRLPQVSSWLETFPEITTPLTSWERLTEGAALSNISSDYHKSDAYHGMTNQLNLSIGQSWGSFTILTPWLVAFTTICRNRYMKCSSKSIAVLQKKSTILLQTLSRVKASSPDLLDVLFIIADVVTALALYRFSRKFLENEYDAQEATKDKLAKGIESILLKYQFHVMRTPALIFSLYFLNPFTVATCASRSTLSFTNMFLSLFLLSTVSGSNLRSALFLALSTYESLYPAQMVVGAGICCWKYQKNSQTSISMSVAKSVVYFTLWLACLFSISYMYEPNIDALLSHLKFILTAPDQSPNVGVFWYFFTETFDHFQVFFMFVFQIHVMVYSIPLTIKLRSHPVFLLFLLVSVIGTFKSYPSWGDAAMWLCLLPMWSHTFSYLRHSAWTWVMLLVSAVLCPVMWHMWIEAHAANANFYFAATLAYTTALVLIMTDTAMAYLHWHRRIRDGLKPLVPGTNEEAIYSLSN